MNKFRKYVGILSYSVLCILPYSAQAASNNILIIIADDLGVDMLSVYGEGLDTPPTPNIDKLVQNGVMFRNAWSNPYCSPTRATIQTGQYGLRTGVGYVVLDSTDNGLPLEDDTIVPLPRTLNEHPELGYTHAAIGKWHLSNAGSSLPGRSMYAPYDAGWKYFSGNWSYMGGFSVTAKPDDYFAWNKLEISINSNGEPIATETQVGDPAAARNPANYVTTVNVDDAISWIGQQTKPWLLYLAFNSPHFPYHAPPESLLNPPRDVSNSNSREKYKAMIEAMDTELGRLMANVDLSTTTVIFLGDNGTPKRDSNGEPIVVAPFNPDKAKGTVYEGGVNVPFIVSGADVVKPGRETDILVNTTDIYTTVLSIAGLDIKRASNIKLDSVSFVPVLKNTYMNDVRHYLYAEIYGKAGLPSEWQRTIRNKRYKLIRSILNKQEPDELFTDSFYDLSRDRFEETDLLKGTLNDEENRNLEELRNQLGLLDQGKEKWSINTDSWKRPVLDFMMD